MDLCSEKHDEICYDGRVCPACDKIDDMQIEINDLKHELKEANDEVVRLENAE